MSARDVVMTSTMSPSLSPSSILPPPPHIPSSSGRSSSAVARSLQAVKATLEEGSSTLEEKEEVDLAKRFARQATLTRPLFA